MHQTQYLVIIVIVLVLCAVFFSEVSLANSLTESAEHFDTCNNQSPSADQIQAMGATAKDACNRVSTKAEEIKAHYDGAANIISAAQSFLNPRNYKSGDNTSDSLMRNIINMNLSTCDITKIAEDCANSVASLQANEIDNTQCEYCKTNLCEIKHITQEQIVKISQTCTIQSAIETLLNKKANVDTLALASVLQEAQSVLSGDNTFKTENCNVITPDLSTASYIEKIANCSNKMAVDQKNSLKFCGNVTEIVQRNSLESYQDCLVSSDLYIKQDVQSEASTKQETVATQKTTGITPMSSASLLICVCLLLLSSAAGAVVAYKMKKQGKFN